MSPTDLKRWANPENLQDRWELRSIAAAKFIPNNATVLDLGCGKMAIERHLPPGCRYIPCDLVQRDERTVLCDFNKADYPPYSGATHITALGLLEYVSDLKSFWAWLAGARARVICSYVPIGMCGPERRRRALGWINDLTVPQLVDLAETAGFRLMADEKIRPQNALFVFDPAN